MVTLKLLPSSPANVAARVSPLSHCSVRDSACLLFSGSGSATAAGAPIAAKMEQQISVTQRWRSIRRPFLGCFESLRAVGHGSRTGHGGDLRATPSLEVREGL